MVARYLSLVSLGQAVSCMRSAFPSPQTVERVPLSRAAGRVTAEPLFAPYTVPGANLAAMDGVAARSADTVGAADHHPICLPSAVRVNTGAVIPEGYDTVILIEDVSIDEQGYWIRKPAGPMQHIRPKGEDITAGSMVMPEGFLIRPFDIGALASYGITHPPVRRVQAALIPTGTELIEPGPTPRPGQVVESNTLMAAAFLEERGVSWTRLPLTRDDPDHIRAALEQAASENDLVIISAGSSAGTRDFTAPVIRDLGEVLIHGIEIKPGKPAIIGRIDDTPVIGLPGYPLSAQTVLREIVSPLLEAWGFPSPPDQRIRVRLAQTLTSELGLDEFVPHTAARIGNRYVATPQSRGAGVQMATIRSNTTVHIPRDMEGYAAESEVDALLTTDRDAVDATLMLSGSTDPILDILQNLLMKESVRAVRSGVGNRGGLLAIERDLCHAAPLHLPGHDGHVVDAVGEELSGLPVAALVLADMPIGIASHRGLSIDDLSDVRFINRQRGQEMHRYTETFFRGRGIDPAGINGTGTSARTHQAVAAAIREGEADAGITTIAAAASCGLTFEQTGIERYALFIREEHLYDPRVAALVRVVTSESFPAVLNQAGLYDTTATGTMVHMNSEPSGKIHRQPAPMKEMFTS